VLDPFAVSMEKCGNVVGHMPRKIQVLQSASCLCGMVQGVCGG